MVSCDVACHVMLFNVVVMLFDVVVTLFDAMFVLCHVT